MDHSLSSHVQHPDFGQTQNRTHPQSAYAQTPTQIQLQTQDHKQEQQQLQLHLQQNQQPPLKRRRANSVNPSTTPTFEPQPQPLPLPPPPTPIRSNQPASPSEHWQTIYTRKNEARDRPTEDLLPRNNSPDRSSRVSVASSQNTSGPQLRKKPKSSSIKNSTTIRAASALLKSPSVPTLHSSTQPDRESVYITTNHSESPNPPISRANSGTSQHLSPNTKRPPASHSSYGVETTCGPPPSYSTQRTLSQERIRKLDRSSQSRMQNPSEPAQTAVLDDSTDANSSRIKESVASLIHSSPDTADTQSIPTPTDTDNMANVKIHGDTSGSTEEEGKASSSDERKSEDLFLNIARVDAARPSYSKPDKRRSRISIPFLSSSRSTYNSRSSPIQSQYESASTFSPRSEALHSHNKRASIGGLPVASSSRGHLLDNARAHEQTPDLTSDSDRVEGAGYHHLGRRSSTTNSESTKLAHRSSTGLRSNRYVSDNAHLDRPKTGEQIATESTISTTAPSTVWDELDDLKSRIRKLELTGKLPSSSAAAMGLSERPRTATTAATTMSTSPKYKASDPNLQPSAESMPSGVHPLLHEALGNARSVVSPEIYSKLLTTAQDALQLVSMTNAEPSGNRSYATSSAIDRQMRRRTESMCRSLTELAIALAIEAKPGQVAGRPASRDQSLPPNSMLRSRRYSNDPGDRGSAPTRVQSRLDSRRTSVHLRQGGTGHSSPERGFVQSPDANLQMSDSRVNRSSTLLRKRGQNSYDGAADDPIDNSPSIRPASRAMTELGSYRRISRDQYQSPREYTSQHPLPGRLDQSATTTTPLPPSTTATNFTSRRKYASPGSVAGGQDHGSMTPRETWGRISIIQADNPSPDVHSEVGGSGRAGSSRRSLGFASRIGSSVGSRLRAVRTERNSRENMEMRASNEPVPPTHGDGTADINDHAENT